MKMETFSQESQVELESFWRNRGELDSDATLVLQPKASSGSLEFVTMAEFAKEMEADKVESCAVCFLSLAQALSPFPYSRGLVHAVLPKASQVVTLVLQTRDSRAGQHMGTRHSVEIGQPGAEGDERGDGEFAPDIAEDQSSLSTDLLAMWDDVFEQVGVAGSSSSSRSSSSSTRSSSSSHKDSSAPAEQNVGEGVKRPAQDDLPEAKQARAVGPRDHTGTVMYGSHLLTPRIKGGSLLGYQMACKHHANCHKEMSCSVAGGADKCRRVLKAWILAGSQLPGRSEHMHSRLKQQLLQGLHNNQLLSEADLDEAVARSSPAAHVSPFIASGHVGMSAASAASQADGSDRVRSDRPGSEAERVERSAARVEVPERDEADLLLLGRRATEVPLAVHQRMLQLARQHHIPRSTLEQRLRNKIADGSSYEVPEPLEEALKHGYLHPNYGAPEGMMWACKGSIWRLRWRGG